MGEGGFKGMEVYITWIQNMVVKCIVNPPSLEICMEAEYSTGLRVSKRWWEHGGINFTEKRVVVAAEMDEQWKSDN